MILTKTIKRSLNASYLLYSGTMFFYYYAMGVFISILSIFLMDKGTSTTDIAFIVSSTAIFTIGIQPFIGVISDKLMRFKIIIYVSMGLSLIGGILFIYINNVWILFVLNGLIQSLIISIAPFFDTLAAKSEHSYGGIRIWGSIGFALSVQVTGLVYDYISQNGVFIMFAIATFLCILLLKPLAEPAYTQKSATQSKSTLSIFKNLLMNKTFVLFLFLSFIIFGMHYANIAYMPVLITTMGGTATNVGMILLLQTMFEIPVLLASDKIFSKLSFRACMLLISLIMVIRFFWYSMMPSTGWVTAMFFFQALSTCLFFVLSIRVVLYMIDETKVNTAMALGGMFGKGIGALTFQLVGGQVLNAFGISALYQFLGVIALIGLGLSCFFKPTRSYSAPSEDLAG